MAEPRCAKCGAKTEEGFLLVRHNPRGHGLAMAVDTWVEGPVKYGFFGLVLRKRRRFRVTLRRCTGCGYVETWATDPVS